MNERRLWASMWAVACLLVAAATTPALAQFDVEAIRGEPFGVGRINVRPSSAMPISGEEFPLYEGGGRLLYPAVEAAPVRRLLRSLLEIEQPRQLTAYFLFVGDGPLEISPFGPSEPALRVRTVNSPGAYNRLLRSWWKAYRAPTRIWNRSGDYPPQVENYLTCMLARRLGMRIADEPLELNLLSLGLGTDPDAVSVLEPLSGTEAAIVKIQRATLLGNLPPLASASLPLPAAVPPPALELPEASEEVEIEPIALHVPEECFYVRCGSFANFLWLRTMLDRAGGELRNLAFVRGVDYRINQRIEQQLGAKSVDFLGDFVISDVAVIGTDTLFREGAAMGILFEARNTDVLTNGIKQQRQQMLENNKQVEETEVELAGRKVSFLSTPDNRVRSFYVVDGDYHFLTTSRTLARRFIEAGQGQGALGGARDFRHARSLMPVKRRDTVFLYLSDALLRGLVSPHYRIEMQRRVQALADIELVQLARLAAQAEGRPADTVEDLIDGGLLPAYFGRRADGSRALLQDGQVSDSLRGPRGAFLPVPDVDVAAATDGELEEYETFTGRYREQWGRVDPFAIGIKRRFMEGGRKERVVIDARLTPFTQETYNKLATQLGSADTRQLAAVPGDLIAAEAVMTEQRVFGGLRDLRSENAISSGQVPRSLLMEALKAFVLDAPSDYLVGYVGATPPGSGLLDRLDLMSYGEPDPAGNAPSLLGLWRHDDDEKMLFSYQPDILEEVSGPLSYEDAERPAQFRLRVADLNGTEWGDFINTIGYSRAQRTSAGNAQFLDSLAQQLHVPEDECLAVAEKILDAKLTCPLGGSYEFRADAQGSGRWRSTAWKSSGRRGLEQVPEGYQSNLLSWFRGAGADMRLEDRTLSAHLELDMQFAPTQPKAVTTPQPARTEAEPLPEPRRSAADAGS